MRGGRNKESVLNLLSLKYGSIIQVKVDIDLELGIQLPNLEIQIWEEAQGVKKSILEEHYI